jgi:NADH:ubiquinone oxidoreductase subunit 6 (subunit J)
MDTLREFGDFLLKYRDAVLAVAFIGGALALLLPRPRPRPVLRGALAAGLALFLVGRFLARTFGFGPDDGLTPEAFLFYVFSGLAILGGGLMLTQYNPARAAICFALVVLSTCGLFLLQAAPFLTAATVIIYAGAIIVTFLFVIMLAQQSGFSDADHRTRTPVLASAAGAVLLGALFVALEKNYDTRDLDRAIAQLRTAAEQNSFADIDAALGQPLDEYLAVLQDGEVERIRKSPADRPNAAGEHPANLIDESIDAVRMGTLQAKNLPETREHLAKIADRLAVVRAGEGSVPPAAKVVRSPFGDSVTSGEGKPNRLPADNVAALGRVLFTDYLLAVELGGTLLLVATIGAIAIAGRRGEKTQ